MADAQRSLVMTTAELLRTEPLALTVEWPYPLLCVFWRLGLAGRRLRPPRAIASDVIRWQAGRTLAAVAATPTLVERALADPTADAFGRLREPMRADAPSRALLLTLARSPLARLSTTHARHTAALVATALLLEPSPHSTTARAPIPLLWRSYLAACLPADARVYVPRTRATWDPVTWSILLDVLMTDWEQSGATLIGMQRSRLFAIAGTRRMARRFRVGRRRALQCGRSAYRMWRTWFTGEIPLLNHIAALRLPEAIATLTTPGALYREARHARRTGTTAPTLCLIDAPVAEGLVALADESIATLRRPVTPRWAPPDITPLVTALTYSPLGLIAPRRSDTTRAAAVWTAERLLRLMTAPWSWAPRPVVRGRRRKFNEARQRHAQLGERRAPTVWTPGARVGEGSGPA